MNIIVFSILILYIPFSEQQQRVAPGVPPQHYQQPPPPQQYQQPPPPQQYQQNIPAHQVPIQQHVPGQQIPVQHIPMQQQVPVPVHQQQQPMHQQQHHGHHQGAPGQILNAANVAHERQHIAEHIDVPMDTSKMTDQELQFHYFKMHDADNNNKLDGCELIKSLIHWHEQGHKDPMNGQPQVEEKIFADQELVGLIDPILQIDDLNMDGFIDYPEFIQAQKKDGVKQGH